VGDPPRYPRDTPLSAKVGTKFRQQVAVAQWVQFACGLRDTEFVRFIFFPLMYSILFPRREDVRSNEITNQSSIVGSKTQRTRFCLNSRHFLLYAAEAV
jgi:hypothetical protein